MKFRLIYSLFLLLAIACQAPKSDDLTRWKSQAAQVEILRDDFGVPHIYGKTDADAVFGLLFAQCEDDFRRVERNYIWATGRLAELEGERAIYSDLRAHLYMTEEEARDAYEKSPDWLKALCRAFADGINYYLYTHPEVIPQVIMKYEPWFPMYFSEGSIGGDIERISEAGIKAFYEGNQPLAFLGETSSDILEEPKGSNGIAVSGKLTQSGNSMLLINPHTSFYFRPEVHVVSEEGLNAYGAVTWGQFFVYQGFNEKTGWIHTSTFVDFIDEFEEKVTESEGKFQYAYGSEMRPVDSLEIILKYQNGDSLKQKTFQIYRTHHGPITHKTGEKWVATKINWDPVNALIQSYTRTKLNNHAEFKKMMDIRTNSSNNTVFADSEGNIAYFHGNFIPKRNLQFDFSKPVDGSNPETDWQGLHTVDESIMLLNPATGWIQNCNSTPFTAAGDQSPKKEFYPAYMAPDQENFRGIHAVRVLKEVNNLTLDSFLDMAYDPYLPAFEYLIPELVQAFEQSGKGKGTLKDVLEVLKAWDFRTSKESIAMSIAHFYGENYQKKFKSMNRFINPAIDYKIPSNEEILMVLEQTIMQMEEDFGTWNTAWGEINRFQRLSGEIDLQYDDAAPYVQIGLASGNWGALAAYGARTFEGTKRLYGYRGNSFVAVVEFGEKVKARSILAGGQSSDPSSAHFIDQVQRYADANFKDVAFYREDVEKNLQEKYIPGKRIQSRK